MRIAIDCGEAFADEAAASQGRIGGDVFNTASRLQAAAEPGDVLVSAAAERLLRGRVELAPLGAIELKGKAEPVHAHKVLAVRLVPTRIETPLVGRDRHLIVLRQALEDAIEDRACVLVTVVAPPGVGKSRLAATFADAVRERAMVLVGQTPSYGDGVTFAPLVELLSQAAGQPSGDAEEIATALRERLVDEPDGEAVGARLARSWGSAKRSRPTPPGRSGACSRSSQPSSLSSWCSKTSTGRSRRCSTLPMPSSSVCTVPCSSCASRDPSSSNSVLPGRPASHVRSRRRFPRSRRRMPGASPSTCSGPGRPHPSSTGSARPPKGIPCTWSSSSRCSRIKGSSRAAGGWVQTTPASRSPRPCRRSWPRGSIGSIPHRV